MSKPKRKQPSRHVIVLGEIRRAVADYMGSEGCSCCSDHEAHSLHRLKLAKLLGIPEHKEQKGWHDFSRFRSKK